MSTMWPSQRTSTTSASKSKPVTSTIPTDWVSGWLVTLLILGVVAVVLALLLPLAIQALDSMTTITDALNHTTRRGA